MKIPAAVVVVPPPPAPPPPPAITREASHLYWLGGVGSCLLFIGPFCPVMFAPMVGQVNFVVNGRGDGVLVVLMALAAGVIMLAKQFRWLCVPASIALGVVGVFVLNFWSTTSEMQRRMRDELRGNPFRGIVEAVSQQTRLEYGVGVMGLGAALLLVASVLAWRAHPRIDRA